MEEQNKRLNTRLLVPILIVITILLVDQASKTLVKNAMALGETIPVIKNVFYLHFIENEGMAYGLSLGPNVGKLILSSFRVIFVGIIAIMVYDGVKSRKPFGLVVSLSLVLGGALGNLIDSIFYGVIYNYAPLMYGRVVDMLYFPVINTDLPAWIPILGGQHFIFFSPIFNIADSCITIGAILIVVFYSKYISFGKPAAKK